MAAPVCRIVTSRSPYAMTLKIQAIPTIVITHPPSTRTTGSRRQKILWARPTAAPHLNRNPCQAIRQ